MSKWKFEIEIDLEDKDPREFTEKILELVKKMFREGKAYSIGGTRI